MEMPTKTAQWTQNPTGPMPLGTRWAYVGTDDDAVWQFELSTNNSLPAMIVWLTMTVNSDLLSTGGDPFVPQLAAAAGLTECCVRYIRNLANAEDETDSTGIAAAFNLVSKRFLKIGHPMNGQNEPRGQYPPATCPGMPDIMALAQPPLSRAPVNPPPSR